MERKCINESNMVGMCSHFWGTREMASCCILDKLKCREINVRDYVKISNWNYLAEKTKAPSNSFLRGIDEM